MLWLFAVSLVILSLLLIFKAYESNSDDLLVFTETRKQLDRWLVEKNRLISDYVRGGFGWVWSQCSEALMVVRRYAARGLRSLASRIDLGQ